MANVDFSAINLELMNRLFAELKLQMQIAASLETKMKEDKSDENYTKFVIEASKAVGLLNGLVQEATAVGADIQKVVQLSYAFSSSAKKQTSSLLEDLFSSKKGISGN